jgi:hypothetical protein
LFDTSTMGIQSQNREGAIKKCRKTATKVKYKRKQRSLLQSAVTGGLAFYSQRDCLICKARTKSLCLSRFGISVQIPHKPHHSRCTKNRKTQGRSERFVQDNKATDESLQSIAVQSPRLPTAKLPPPAPAPILPAPAPVRPACPVQQFVPITTATIQLLHPTTNPFTNPFTNTFVPYPAIAAPKDCCYLIYPFYCNKYSSYLLRKHQNGGGGVFGRKPHDSDCSASGAKN